MKNRILFLFIILFGILLLYNLGFTLKEGLTNKEIYDLIRKEQDEEAIGKFFKDNYNIDDKSNSIILSNLLNTGNNNDKILNDLYAPKSSMVPPICPACPISCPEKTKCPPCPPCGRCPESTFTCEKVKKNYLQKTKKILQITNLNVKAIIVEN